jgi:hypothetical protein
MKRVAAPALLVLLCALPVQGSVPLDTRILHGLTPIDSVPTKEDLADVFRNADPVTELAAIATDADADLGVQLRAIRALAQYCDQCQNALPHAVLVEVIQGVAPGDHSGSAILRLRAGIEALGAAKSGNTGDVPLLVPFLDSSSRDIRVATARALRDLCDTRAIVPLRARYQEETVAQVRLAISAALRDLGNCSVP